MNNNNNNNNTEEADDKTVEPDNTVEQDKTIEPDKTIEEADINNDKKFICNYCDFKCSKNSNWEKHLLTKKHKHMSRLKKNFVCKTCKFECFKKSNWEKHLLTNKHKLCNNNVEELCKNYYCICGKEYTHRQGLYAHKKQCTYVNKPQENISFDIKNLLTELLKQNNDYQQKMLGLFYK